MMIVMPFLIWLSPCLHACFVIWWDADFGQSRMISYIYSHNHVPFLPRDAWELLGMCGIQGAVISAGSPYLSGCVRSEVPGPSEMEGFR